MVWLHLAIARGKGDNDVSHQAHFITDFTPAGQLSPENKAELIEKQVSLFSFSRVRGWDSGGQ